MESVILRRLRTYTSVPNGARKGICQVDELSSESVPVKMLPALSIGQERERKRARVEAIADRKNERKETVFISYRQNAFLARNAVCISYDTLYNVNHIYRNNKYNIK